MRNMLKNVTIASISTFMILTPLNNVRADNLNNELQNKSSYVSIEDFNDPIDVLNVNTREDNLKMTKSLDNMNDEQLNEVIDYVANNKNNISYRSTASNTKNKLKVAWKAAAKIARNNGYPLAGTLVEYSVEDIRYYEANGMFSDAIKKTKVYDRMKSHKGEGQEEFTTNDSKDLYYALHGVTYYHGKNNRLFITDTFDFELNTDYKNTFSTLVNNWAYLNQNIDVLNPINVTIEMQ